MRTSSTRGARLGTRAGTCTAENEPYHFVSSSSREFEFELWNFEPLMCSPVDVQPPVAAAATTGWFSRVESESVGWHSGGTKRSGCRTAATLELSGTSCSRWRMTGMWVKSEHISYLPVYQIPEMFTMLYRIQENLKKSEILREIPRKPHWN